MKTTHQRGTDKRVFIFDAENEMERDAWIKELELAAGIKGDKSNLREPYQDDPDIVGLTKNMEGTWYVTHSTLPLWRDKKHVSITYKVLPSGQLDDEVQYMKRTDADNIKRSSIRGVDTCINPNGGCTRWNWRGKGWLMIASSQWELLGGSFTQSSQFEQKGVVSEAEADLTDGKQVEASNSTDVQCATEQKGVDNYSSNQDWAVTFFAKTLFTPAGMDIYSRRPEGLSEGLLQEIFVNIRKLHSKETRKLVELFFEVPRNIVRNDAKPL